MKTRVSSAMLTARLGLAFGAHSPVQPAQLRVDKIGVEQARISVHGAQPQRRAAGHHALESERELPR